MSAWKDIRDRSIGKSVCREELPPPVEKTLEPVKITIKQPKKKGSILKVWIIAAICLLFFTLVGLFLNFFGMMVTLIAVVPFIIITINVIMFRGDFDY